jgi:hypothetical protein
MSIIKNQININFTMFPNSILNDSNLSLQAKGLVLYILSKPKGWEFSIKGMASQLKESAPRIMRIIDELCELGYMIKYKTRNGKVQGVNRYELFETPCFPSESQNVNHKMGITKCESQNVTTSNTIISNTITSKKEKEKEEEELTKNSFSDLTSFLSMFRLNFSGIDFNLDGNIYFVSNSGFLLSSSSNKKISVGLAKDIYKRLFEKWDIAKSHFYTERAKKLLTKVA